MKRYSICHNSYDQSLKIKKQVNDFLLANNFIKDQQNPELVFIIGGDGTLLRAVHQYEHNLTHIIFIPIHSGSLGFYSTFAQHSLSNLFSYLQNNDIHLKYMPLLEVLFNKDQKRYVINEVKIIDNQKTIKTKVFIDNEFLQFFRGTGLVFATNSGSTGYLRVIGGAIILKNNIWEMQEIAPVSNASFSTIYAPIILSSEQFVRLKGDFTGLSLIYDTNVQMLSAKEIIISLSKQKLQILIDPQNNLSLTCRLKHIFALAGKH